VFIKTIRNHKVVLYYAYRPFGVIMYMLGGLKGNSLGNFNFP